MPLSKKTPVEIWIKDFLKSDKPQFSGKSPEKRKEMALAAYYAKQKNEEELSDLIMLEDLEEITEAILSPDHPLFKAAKAESKHQEIHSIKHAGDSNNGKYAHLEVRVKDRSNPNAVRIKKMVVHKETGETQKSSLGQHLTDVRHLDTASVDYENYNTILEYRIRNSHNEDMQNAFDAGKKAFADSKECNPDTCPALYAILCKHADISQDLKVHFKNSWIRGYSSNSSEDVDESLVCENISELYETVDLTKFINPFAKHKKTSNKKHFIGIMNVRRIQHVGHMNDDPKFTVEKKGHISVHSIHGENGKLVVGVWDHKKGEGKYVPPMPTIYTEEFEVDLHENIDLVKHFSGDPEKRRQDEVHTRSKDQFREMMKIRRLQHVGHLNDDPKFTVTHIKKDDKLDVHIHHAHDGNGNSVIVGVWNNLKDEGRYIKVTHQRGRDEKMTTESLNEEDVHGKTVLSMKKHWAGELRKSPYIVVKKGTAIPHRENDGQLKEVPMKSDNIPFHSKDDAEKIASKGVNHEAIHHEEFLKRKGIGKDMYESEENIDEISQSTLMSYGKKAGSEKANAEKLSKDPNAGSRMQNAASEILKKRKAGLDRLEKRAEKVNVTEEATEESTDVVEVELTRFEKISKEITEKYLNKASKE